MPSAVVIAQSIAKVLAPMCFQNEAPVFEHVFECVLDQHVFKCVGTRKCIPNMFKNIGLIQKHVMGLNSFI